MVEIRGITLVESAGRRYSSDYPEQRQWRFDLTLEPLNGAPSAALVALKVSLAREADNDDDAPTPAVYESTIKYLVHGDTDFSPSLAPDFARAAWDRLREDTVRLALQFGLSGLPLPPTSDSLIQRSS